MVMASLTIFIGKSIINTLTLFLKMASYTKSIRNMLHTDKIIHLLFLHQIGSNNPIGLNRNIDKIPFLSLFQ